jgi:hypothetical protein
MVMHVGRAPERPDLPRSGLGKVREFGQAATLVKRTACDCTVRRECAWRQPDVTGEHVTILAAGKCVAACRSAVLQWARRAATDVLCIWKEVPAMFANRQTPPRVAL